MTQKTLSEVIINLSLPAALFGNKVNCEFPHMPPVSVYVTAEQSVQGVDAGFSWPAFVD